MRLLIYAAVGLLIIGTIFPLLRGDGAGAAKGMIGGVGVLIIVLSIWGAILAGKYIFKIKSAKDL